MANREIEARLKLSAVDKTQAAFRKVGGRLDDINRRTTLVNRTAAAMGRAQMALAARGGARREYSPTRPDGR